MVASVHRINPTNEPCPCGTTIRPRFFRKYSKAHYCGFRCPVCGYEVGGILRAESAGHHWDKYAALESQKRGNNNA